LTPLKFVRRGMIKGMVKAGYHGKEDRGLEGFYGIGDSYPKKLCWGKASKWNCCRESGPLFRVLRHHTPSSHRYASPKRYASPSPYRAYSSYPVGGKVSFSWRKKRLLVVVFLCLRT